MLWFFYQKKNAIQRVVIHEGTTMLNWHKNVFYTDQDGVGHQITDINIELYRALNTKFLTHKAMYELKLPIIMQNH